MTGGKKQRWSVRIALIAVGTIAALGLAEGVLRAVGFRYRLYPEHIEFGFPNPAEMKSTFVPHDELLWVQPDYEEELARAREQQPPLLLMGCSCTAWGRFDEGLAQRVAERRGGRELEFVNLAFAGWSSFQGREQMRRDVGAIAPKVVTIFYGWNDHWIGFGVDDATAAELNQSVLFPLQRLRLVQFVNKALVGFEAQDKAEEGPLLRVGPEDYKKNLEEMVDLARSFGATPVLLTAPTSHRAGHEPEYLARRWLEKLEDLVPLHQQYIGIVRQVAAEQGVPLCDLEAAIGALSVPARAQLFRQDGIHFTDAGDEFVAELLYTFFDSEGLFEELLPGSG